MTPVNFAYWLQGFFEISDSNTLTPETLKDKSNLEKLKYQKIHDGAESGDKITEKDFDELIKKSAPAISKYQDEPKSFFYDDSRITYNC